MSRRASNIPLLGASVENGSIKSLTPSFISTSDDGKKHKIRNVPYVILLDMPSGNIVKSYYDYVYTYLHNAVSSDYRNIPYMRHLDESIDNHLYDVNIDPDKIKMLLRKKFTNSSLELLDVDIQINREEKLATIVCRLEYKGIIVNAEILKKVSTNERSIIENLRF